MNGTQTTRRDKKRSRHFHITRGTVCEVRRIGKNDGWRQYVTRKRLFFLEMVECNGDLIFTLDDWELQVNPTLVRCPGSSVCNERGPDQ